MTEGQALYYLRILSGAHEGALVPLDAGEWTLGADFGADFMISDLAPGKMWKIIVDQSTVSLKMIEGGLSRNVDEFAAEKPLDIGPVKILISKSATSKVSAEPVRATKSPEPVKSAEPQYKETPRPKPSAGKSGQDLRREAFSRPKKRRGGWVPVVGLGLAAAVSYFVFFPHHSEQALPETKSLAEVLKDAPIHNAHIDIKYGATPTLTGMVNSSEDLSNIKTYIAKNYTGAVEYHIKSLDEAIEKIKSAIEQMNMDLDVHPGANGVVISGFFADPEKAKSFLWMVNNELVTDIPVENRLVTLENLQDKAHQFVMSHGLSGRWAISLRDPKTVSLETLFSDPSQVAEWRALSSQLQAEVRPAAWVENMRPLPRLAAPRGLWIKRRPYLILEDNTQLEFGSKLQGGLEVAGIDRTGIIVRLAGATTRLEYPSAPKWTEWAEETMP